MRVAFFLDNRGIAGLGPLPDPRFGNPGIGGTEFAFLAVAALLQESAEPLVLLTRDQPVAGLQAVEVVDDLSQALQRAKVWGAAFLVFRPGVLAPGDWPALEHSPLPLVAWLHNLGCLDQARTEALPALRAWVLVSGAQLDFFRHSRLSRQAVVIPNPVLVPAAGVRSIETALAARDLAYVGAITPFKAFDRLAAQWGVIARACPEARLRVFGGADLYGQRSGEQFTSYEIHCRRLLDASGAADRVLFEGSCGLERYGHLDSVAVGVVNPSGVDETFCLSAAELLLCGIPVVSARRHALVHTVPHQRAGLLARNDDEMAAQCIQLLRDPGQAWQLGSLGHDYAAQAFSVDAVLTGWLALAEMIHLGASPAILPVSTPWHHEQRWLRQWWGAFLVMPGWPSWPSLKAALKRLLQGSEQAIGPRGVGLLAGLVALLVWALLVFGKYGGNPTGLARIGDQMTISPSLHGLELVVLEGKRGNDGQQFLALALDPLQLDPGTTAAVDNPIYRGKRFLYPFLAWLIGLGQPKLIVWTMGLINVSCIGFAARLVAAWAQLEQRSPQWGLAVLVLPAYWITLTLNTADLLATTLMLSAALAWKRQRLFSAWSSLAAALLSRETALLAWAASGLSALWERRWSWLGPLALVPLPMWVLTAILQTRFSGVQDSSLASLHFTWPLAGVFRKVVQLYGLVASPSFNFDVAEGLFDAICFGLWIFTLGVLVCTCCFGWGGRWLRWASGLYLLPSLCTSMQILGRFPDYTRVWIDLAGLGLLAMLSARANIVKVWLALSTIVSIGYLTGFVFVAP